MLDLNSLTLINTSELLEAFINIFVAISPITAFVMFLATTESLNEKETKALTKGALSTVSGVALILILGGGTLFDFLGIGVNDLRVAGGLILLTLSIYDLVFSREDRKTKNTTDNNDESPDAAIVPLGIPLIMGPACMTAIIVLSEEKGVLLALLAFFSNIILLAILFYNEHIVRKFINRGVSRAIGKIMSLLMGTIAVAMIKTGIAGFISSI